MWLLLASIDNFGLSTPKWVHTDSRTIVLTEVDLKSFVQCTVLRFTCCLAMTRESDLEVYKHRCYARRKLLQHFIYKVTWDLCVVLHSCSQSKVEKSNIIHLTQMRWENMSTRFFCRHGTTNNCITNIRIKQRKQMIFEIIPMGRLQMFALPLCTCPLKVMLLIVSSTYSHILRALSLWKTSLLHFTYCCLQQRQSLPETKFGPTQGSLFEVPESSQKCRVCGPLSMSSLLVLVWCEKSTCLVNGP